ncbi:MAG: type I DNA topoisomerase [Anaerolineales bacterium]
MEAYCVKCKVKRTVQNPVATYTKKAQPGTKGVCGECGTGLYRMGNTPAHEGMVPPVPTPSKTRKKTRSQSKRGKFVIVESTTKAKTIGRILGKGYKVESCVGHVRDLLKSRMAVDPENEFEPEWRVPNDKRKIVKGLKEGASRAAEVYLATDLDREGEAIAWHLAEVLEVEEDRLRRVTFHEITRPAIEEAFEQPRNIKMDLVNAQEARRKLDRLVGFSLSQLLWEKVAGRLSAGRVQSPTLRLIVERQREIDAHVAKEHWSIKAQLLKRLNKDDGKYFEAGLRKVDGNKVGVDEKYHISNETQVKPILIDLERSQWQVQSVRRAERRRKPYAPFRTSTMQQEASGKLNFSVQKTMAIAQQLYQGQDGLDEGGLITYMRTDSVQVSPQSQQQARDFISGNYGKEYLPDSPPRYSKSKSSQEAHEAIRPTSIERTPESVKNNLSTDQYKLYKLIWARFLSSQMSQAIFDTLRVDIVATGEKGIYDFRSTGRKIRFDGFLRVYQPASDQNKSESETQDIPELEDDEKLFLHDLISEQKFTKPPALYTEATLVKALEKHGIGRPSTYAPTVKRVVDVGYVIKDNRRLSPTDTGMTVNDWLVKYFPNVLDTKFTAIFEDDLDLIAQGKKHQVPVLQKFWLPFEKDLEHAKVEMPTIDKTPELAGRNCPKCGEELLIRNGRFGKFIGCSGFPECRHTEQILQKIGVGCPDCSNDLVQRKTRKGRVFYGCVSYPECEWTSWVRPLTDMCPECRGILFEKGKSLVKCGKCEKEWSKEDINSSATNDSSTEESEDAIVDAIFGSS